MVCPFLEYRAADADREFGGERAYCGAAERFVQPMRADICNDRYDLSHDRHCEIYLEHADGSGGTDDGGTGGGSASVDPTEDAG